MNLFTNRNSLTDLEIKLMVTKGKMGGRDESGDWEWHIYLLYLKQITDRTLLCSRGNSTQYSVTIYTGKESEKESTCQCWRRRRCGFSPQVGKIPLEQKTANHSSILAWRIPMDRGAWVATVHGVAKSWTRLTRRACIYHN